MTTSPALGDKGELEPTLRRAAAWLEQNGLGVFWGQMESEEGFPDAAWDVKLVPEVEPFLILAKASDAKLVVIDCTVCDFRELREKAKGAESPELDRLAAMLTPRDGELVEISFTWLGGRVLYRFTLCASWADAYFTAWELVESESSENEDDDDEDEEPDEEEVRGHSEALAREPKFQAARSTAQRAYAARKTLDASVLADKPLFTAILLEAKNIFDIELKPGVDKKLAEEVQQLRDQGLTKAQIATRLGISSNKMKTMF